MPAVTSYTHPLTADQVATLRQVLDGRGFDFVEKPYTEFAAKKDKVNVAVYTKGPKVLVQGKGTEDFVRFLLEPEVLGEAKLGYEEEHHPERFAPHIGIDESGKGDFFGPLVVAAVYSDGDIARAFVEAGVADSKRITSDTKIRKLADAVRATRGAVWEVITIAPDRYNMLYEKFGNVNRMLAWGHARVLENVLERRPDCPRALSDKFANEAVLRTALMERGRKITLDQQTKAEVDPAVAAASILAREGFVNWLRDHGDLPKGVSAAVKERARQIDRARLPEFVKMHFRTAEEL